MSRSYKKHMGGSYCGGSDKYSRSVIIEAKGDQIRSIVTNFVKSMR